MSTETTKRVAHDLKALDLASTDRQRIELAIELIENVPGKSISGARSLLRSALKKL